MQGFPATHRARREGGRTPAAGPTVPLPRPHAVPCPARPRDNERPLLRCPSAGTAPPLPSLPRERRRCLPPHAPLRRAPAPRRPAPGGLAAPPRRCRCRPPVPHAPFNRRHLALPEPPPPPRSGPSATSVPRGPPPPAPHPRPRGESTGGRGARGETRGAGGGAPRTSPHSLCNCVPPPPRTHLPIAMCRRRVCHQICSGNRSPSHVSSHLPRPPPPAGPSGPVPRCRTREAWRGAPVGRREPVPEVPRSCHCPGLCPWGTCLPWGGAVPGREEGGSWDPRSGCPDFLPTFSPVICHPWRRPCPSTARRELCGLGTALHPRPRLVARRCCQEPSLAWAPPGRDSHTPLPGIPAHETPSYHISVHVVCGNFCKAAHVIKNTSLLSGPSYPSIEYFFSLKFHYRNLKRQKTCKFTSCRCPGF